MVAEAHVPSHGALGTGAAAALTAGVVLALSGAGAPGGAVVAAGAAVALAGLALAWLLLGMPGSAGNDNVWAEHILDGCNYIDAQI